MNLLTAEELRAHPVVTEDRGYDVGLWDAKDQQQPCISCGKDTHRTYAIKYKEDLWRTSCLVRACRAQCLIRAIEAARKEHETKGEVMNGETKAEDWKCMRCGVNATHTTSGLRVCKRCYDTCSDRDKDHLDALKALHSKLTATEAGGISLEGRAKLIRLANAVPALIAEVERLRASISDYDLNITDILKSYARRGETIDELRAEVEQLNTKLSAACIGMAEMEAKNVELWVSGPERESSEKEMQRQKRRAAAANIRADKAEAELKVAALWQSGNWAQFYRETLNKQVAARRERDNALSEWKETSTRLHAAEKEVEHMRKVNKELCEELCECKTLYRLAVGSAERIQTDLEAENAALKSATPNA